MRFTGLILALLIPVAVYAAIDSADKRRSSAGDVAVPDGGINTAGERRASAGDYSFGLGESGGGSGSAMSAYQKKKKKM